MLKPKTLLQKTLTTARS